MISVIITTYKEPLSLPRAIEAFLNQPIDENSEILVVGPDKQTEKIVKKFSEKYSQIKYLKDKGIGKPAALNLAIKQCRGEIIVLTDGDVWIEQGSLKKLLSPFKDVNIGAVSGHPISVNPKNNLFGYWSHFLTNAAHLMRLNKIFPCSGYFYAIRKELIDYIPKNIFSEDAFITQIIRDKGYHIRYIAEAKVFVKYPTNFKDWLSQKNRSTGGYIQNIKFQNSDFKTKKGIKKMRNPAQETFDGIKLFFTYPKNLKEFFWTILLYLSRIYLWLTIFWNIKIKKKRFNQIWKRIESTK